MKNRETTSQHVARIAAKIMASDHVRPAVFFTKGKLPKEWILQNSELRALAASCLTQAPDKRGPVTAAQRARVKKPVKRRSVILDDGMKRIVKQ